jgi:23S rRNA pseudouridine955/2504/2580 synthase
MMDDINTKFQKVRFVTVTEQSEGQRIDNFLMRELGNVPKSLVYKILRKGEVRVNKGRAKPSRKLSIDDIVRIPPIWLEEKTDKPVAKQQLLDQVGNAILLEDNDILLINKPAGLPVHGGSGYQLGLIEVFRQLRPNIPYIELAHRLDKDTSGILILAKSRQALQALHLLFNNRGIDKRYLTLVAGRWRGGERHIENELVKKSNKREKIQVGKGNEGGKRAESLFKPRECYDDYSLLEVKLFTGRMHQIRTQLAHLKMPVIGDERYGDFALNRQFKKQLGIKRLFLHAFYIDFTLEFSGRHYHLEIPLADDLQLAVDSGK